MGSIGSTQIINGKSYTMYTPAWYAAMEEDKVHTAATDGTAAGTKAGSALNALQSLVPGVYGNGVTSQSSSSSSSSGSGSGGGSSMPYATYPGSGGNPSIPYGGAPGGAAPQRAQVQLEDVNRSGAEEAIFNRAKDKVGQTTQSSLTGLRSALGARGQLGGGGEFHGTERLLEAGAGELADTSREQAIDSASRAENAAALRFTGGISQRGQDMSSDEAARALAAQIAATQYQGQISQRGQDVTMRGQDFSKDSLAMSQQQQYQNMILEALRSLSY